MPSVYVQWNWDKKAGTGVKILSGNCAQFSARTHGFGAPQVTMWGRGAPQMAEISAITIDYSTISDQHEGGVRVLVFFTSDLPDKGAVAFSVYQDDLQYGIPEDEGFTFLTGVKDKV